jgi:hypothetical protein
MSIKAKNINGNGTSHNTCKCGSWLEHWKKFGGGAITYCSEQSCVMNDLAGAHVMKAADNDNNWYIIPLCEDHNKMQGQDLEIVVSTVFVPADTKETCGKKERSLPSRKRGTTKVAKRIKGHDEIDFVDTGRKGG